MVNRPLSSASTSRGADGAPSRTSTSWIDALDTGRANLSRTAPASRPFTGDIPVGCSVSGGDTNWSGSPALFLPPASAERRLLGRFVGLVQPDRRTPAISAIHQTRLRTTPPPNPARHEVAMTERLDVAL